MPPRARSKATAPSPVKAVPDPTPTDEEGTESAPRVTAMHQVFSDWLAAETGVTVDPLHIFLVTSKRTAFRKSDEYDAYLEEKDAERAEADEAKEKARADRAAAKTAEPEDDTPAPKRRGRKAVEDVDAEAGEDDAPAPRRGRRAAAPKPGATLPGAKAEGATAAPRRSRRASSGKPATEPAF